MRRTRRLAAMLTVVALLAAAGQARAAYVQLGPKLAPFDMPVWMEFGGHVALAADGRTALASSMQNVWAFVREPDGSWAEQTAALPFDRPLLWNESGLATALSADGDTALVAGSFDEAGTPRDAVWTFVRTNGTWVQDGAPLTVTDADLSSYDRGFAADIHLSSDGRTLLADGSSGSAGVAWIFARQGSAWVQQGPTLSASGLALSADGDTALMRSWNSLTQAATVTVRRRTGSNWTLDGPPLTAAGGEIGATGALDADGSSAVLSGTAGGSKVLWTFDRGGGQWDQAGPPSLGAHDFSFIRVYGLSADGERALVSDVTDDGDDAVALLRRAGGGWTPDALLTPSDAVENSTPDPSPFFGSAAAFTPDAATVMVGGRWDNDAGAVWTFGTAATQQTILRMRAFAGTKIALGPIAAGVVLDRGNNPTGTIAFRVYGSTADCVGPPLQAATVPVNGNDTYFAPGLMATELTLYAVSASYSGDGRNAPAATSCRDAQFEVLNGLHLSVDVRGLRTVGAPLTIAPTLTDGTTPTGDVTISVFGTSDPRCARDPVFSQNATVHNGRIPAVAYTPSGTGRLRVTVFYGGDGQNPPVELGCGDASVDVGPASPAIAASASPPVAVGGAIGAAARVDGYHPGGSVTFRLFRPGDEACAGRPLATLDAPLTDGVAQSEALATTAAGTYHLTAAYAGDRNNGAVASPCAAGAVAVAKSRPALLAAASSPARGVLMDSAELRGGFHPQGNVRFDLYGRRDPDCRRPPVFTILAPLGDDARATTTPLDRAAAGRYQFVVRYGGDGANEAAETVCGANSVRVSAASRRSRAVGTHRRHRRRHARARRRHAHRA